jgi:hypothetical protein
LVSPAASASPDPSSSAASTPPISSAGSDIDIDAEDQYDIDRRNSVANSPDAIVISDSSDAEKADDGYGSDDLMSEMDGEELRESLQLQMQGNCYATWILSLQPDFQEQKSLVQETIEAAGHLCIFLPKFHCKLNFIEFFWGAVKRYLQEHCNYTYDGLRANIPKALASVEL